MKSSGIQFGVLAAALIATGSPALGHEECDEVAQAQTADAEHVGGGEARELSKVTVKLFQYQPGRIQVRAGATVTWINEDEILHTVTAEEAKKGGDFDAPLDGKGKSFSFTFNQPGIYRYYCDRHEQMQGEIEVR